VGRGLTNGFEDLTDDFIPFFFHSGSPGSLFDMGGTWIMHPWETSWFRPHDQRQLGFHGRLTRFGAD
jgi:hypothetical protein